MRNQLKRPIAVGLIVLMVLGVLMAGVTVLSARAAAPQAASATFSPNTGLFDKENKPKDIPNPTGLDTWWNKTDAGNANNYKVDDLDGSNKIPAGIFPTDPTKTGFVFVGWYAPLLDSSNQVVKEKIDSAEFTATDLSKPYSVDSAFTVDTAVYARWEKPTELLFDPAPGKFATPDKDAAGKDLTTIKKTTDGKMKPIFPVPDPTRADYVFAGWFAWMKKADPMELLSVCLDLNFAELIKDLESGDSSKIAAALTSLGITSDADADDLSSQLSTKLETAFKNKKTSGAIFELDGNTIVIRATYENGTLKTPARVLIFEGDTFWEVADAPDPKKEEELVKDGEYQKALISAETKFYPSQGVVKLYAVWTAPYWVTFDINGGKVFSQPLNGKPATDPGVTSQPSWKIQSNDAGRLPNGLPQVDPTWPEGHGGKEFGQVFWGWYRLEETTEPGTPAEYAPFVQKSDGAAQYYTESSGTYSANDSGTYLKYIVEEFKYAVYGKEDNKPKYYKLDNGDYVADANGTYLSYQDASNTTQYAEFLVGGDGKVVFYKEVNGKAVVDSAGTYFRFKSGETAYYVEPPEKDASDKPIFYTWKNNSDGDDEYVQDVNGKYFVVKAATPETKGTKEVYATGGELVTEDILYKAKWKDPVLVTFHPNEGYFTIPDTLPTNQTIQVRTGPDGILVPEKYPAPPIRSGYVFKGWATRVEVKKDASNNPVYEYTDVVDRQKIPGDENATITYYAKWKKLIPVTFDFNFTDPTAKIDTIMVEEDQKIHPGQMSSLVHPYRKGYVVVSWNTRADGKGDTLDIVTKIITEPITYYAVWKVAVEIKYDGNQGSSGSSGGGGGGGGGTTTTQVPQGGTAGFTQLPPTPVKEGYTFVGWYTAPEGGKLVTESTVIDSNTTLYAHWSANVKPLMLYGMPVKNFNNTPLSWFLVIVCFGWIWMPLL